MPPGIVSSNKRKCLSLGCRLLCPNLIRKDRHRSWWLGSQRGGMAWGKWEEIVKKTPEKSFFNEINPWWNWEKPHDHILSTPSKLWQPSINCNVFDLYENCCYIQSKYKDKKTRYSMLTKSYNTPPSFWNRAVRGVSLLRKPTHLI